MWTFHAVSPLTKKHTHTHVIFYLHLFCHSVFRFHSLSIIYYYFFIVCIVCCLSLLLLFMLSSREPRHDVSFTSQLYGNRQSNWNEMKLQTHNSPRDRESEWHTHTQKTRVLFIETYMMSTENIQLTLFIHTIATCRFSSLQPLFASEAR